MSRARAGRALLQHVWLATARRCRTTFRTRLHAAASRQHERRLRRWKKLCAPSVRRSLDSTCRTTLRARCTARPPAAPARPARRLARQSSRRRSGKRGGNCDRVRGIRIEGLRRLCDSRLRPAHESHRLLASAAAARCRASPGRARACDPSGRPAPLRAPCGSTSIRARPSGTASPPRGVENPQEAALAALMRFAVALDEPAAQRNFEGETDIPFPGGGDRASQRRSASAPRASASETRSAASQARKRSARNPLTLVV